VSYEKPKVNSGDEHRNEGIAGGRKATVHAFEYLFVPFFFEGLQIHDTGEFGPNTVASVAGKPIKYVRLKRARRQGGHETDGEMERVITGVPKVGDTTSLYGKGRTEGGQLPGRDLNN
jgi:hypothetical protein